MGNNHRGPVQTFYCCHAELKSSREVRCPNQTFELSLDCFETYNKKDRSPFLLKRYERPIYPIYAYHARYFIRLCYILR